MRGEVGMLRGQISGFKKADQSRSRAEQDAKQLLANVKSEVTLERDKAQFKMEEIKTINTVKQVLLACKIYIGDNNTGWPTNFEQIQMELGSMPTNLLDGIEFVNVGIVEDRKYPQMVAFRERAPRKSLDGAIWHRVYGLADGSVQTAKSAEGNFDAWEKQNTTPPPANQ